MLSACLPKLINLIRFSLARVFLIAAFFLSTCSCAAVDLTSITEWVDKDTGHRVKLVSQDSYSKLPYFTANIFSSDGKYFAYNSPRGIYIASLQDFSSTLLIPFDENQPATLIEMGKKFPRLYYMTYKKKEDRTDLESIDINTLKKYQHGPLPKNYWVTSINADETLALGFSEQPLVLAKKYNGKADKIYNRYLEKIPMTLFTVNLSSGALKDIYLSTDWLSHPQFSPTNASLIMYSLEGPWHLVDRIWIINSDGSDNQLIHKRTLPMEIAGHEFWSKDGKNILYDWQSPKGKEFYLASYNVETKQRTSASVNRDHCSVHYNGSNSDSLMVGDGERESQDLCSKNSAYIFKYRVGAKDGQNTALVSEPLADLRGHNYGMLEPNLRLSNDQRWVIFMSNMFGNSGVFAVELEKATRKNKPAVSTKDLSALRLQRYTEMVQVR